MTQQRVRVVVLDDHQSILDGYRFRLSKTPAIEVVATLGFGEELEPALAKTQVDVLILDVSVPTAPDNRTPYPILHLIPKLLGYYPNLSILVISMFTDRALIRTMVEAGVSGYIFKDDQPLLLDLGNVVLAIANGGIYFSQEARQLILKQRDASNADLLTARQLEALSLYAAYPECSTSDLAQKMVITNSTMRNLLAGAYLRLGVRTRLAAIAKARELGLITSISQT